MVIFLITLAPSPATKRPNSPPSAICSPAQFSYAGDMFGYYMWKIPAPF